MIISISEYRDLAARWLAFVCGGAKGRTEQDPIYRRVTEGRDDGRLHGYSSCGDLAHALYEVMGVRAPFVNRGATWVVGANVSRLANAPTVEQPTPPSAKFYAPGDVLIVWSNPNTSDAHVAVVLEHRPDAPIITCAEYGQPGAIVRNHTYVRRALASGLAVGVGLRVPTDAHWFADSGKAILRVIRLERILEWAAAEGCLSDVDGPGTLRDWGVP